MKMSGMEGVMGRRCTLCGSVGITEAEVEAFHYTVYTTRCTTTYQSGWRLNDIKAQTETHIHISSQSKGCESNTTDDPD